MSQTAVEKFRVAQSAPKITYEEFLAADWNNPHVEWVDGRVETMAPISGEHQDVTKRLIAWLQAFVEQSDSGVIQHEPFQMKTGLDLPGRSPDVLFVNTAHKSRLKKTYLNGPADLVIEVISPESRGRDRGDKFYEYEKGGVSEYWLIDPERMQAEFYVLRRKIYKLAELDAKRIFHSIAMPGVWIDPKWFSSKPLPSVVAVLKWWKLIK